jgi:hypothetical protein
MAVSITVEPFSASTVRALPLKSVKVIFGMRKRGRSNRTS